LDSGSRARLPRAGRFGRRLGGRLGGWVRGAVARWRHLNRLQGISRAEFEQIACDLNLSHPELYGLLTGRSVSADLLEQQLAALESSPDRIGAAQAPDAQRISTHAHAQALLPIGPSCC
jgi:hypothetical protein